MPGTGPIELSGSCGGFNCFDGAHINGHDITCETDVSEADCVATCCSQADCKGFDYSASDHGMGAGRCCTGHVSRVEGGFEKNIGTYRSCEKNSVTAHASTPSKAQQKNSVTAHASTPSKAGFSYHSSPKSWGAARADCKARGGDLASIHSAAENQQAFELSRGGNMWLGLNDRAAEGKWKWSDGTPMDYKRWSESGADSWDGDEDCAGFWDGRGDGSWDDMYGEASCSQPLPYLCGKQGSGRCKARASEVKARASEVKADQVSAGGVAGIVLGAVLVLALAAVGGFLCRRLKKRNVGGPPVLELVQVQATVVQPVVATVVPVAIAV